MRNVACHDTQKLRRLFNASHGDGWIEIVRLCTAKIDAMTMALQLMSTVRVEVRPGWGTTTTTRNEEKRNGLVAVSGSGGGGGGGGGGRREPLDLGLAPTPLMSRLRPNTARVHEWKNKSTNRSRRQWKLSWLPQVREKTETIFFFFFFFFGLFF